MADPAITLVALVRLSVAFATPPSIRRLAEETGLSIHAVHSHLVRLERDGLTARTDANARQVQWYATEDGITRVSKKVRRVPRCHACGQTIRPPKGSA